MAMMSRRAGVAVIFGLAALFGATACKNGGSGGEGGGGGGASQDPPVVLPPTNGQSCQGQSGGTCSDQAAIDAYSSCVIETCDAQYKQCFGDGYASGSFGGACKDLMDCASKCMDCDQACIKACTDQDFVGACKDCVVGPIASCVVDSITSGTCKLPCGPAATSGGACDDLEACCNSMSGADQTSCLSTASQVKLGGDAACSAVLANYKNGGVCP